MQKVVYGFVLSLVAVAMLGCGESKVSGATSTVPKVGDAAPALSLSTLDGKNVDLAALEKTGPVVFVQLRGWVGYQCPLCTKQVGDLLAHAADFAAAKSQVVLSYPGPADGLDEHAKQFISGKDFPENFHFVLDPDLKAVNAWGLRWDKSGETAYPASFVVGTDNKIIFAKVSDSHGGRASATELLAALPK